MAYRQLVDANMKTPYIGGWCQGFVGMAWGQSRMNDAHTETYGMYPTATAAWNAEPNKHYDLPPVGKTVPVYFSLANEKAGHVAISLDDGKIASSTQGGYHTKPFFHPNLDDLIAVYSKYNGKCTYLGWGEHVGTLRVIQGDDMVTTKEQLDRLYTAVLQRPRGAGEGEDVYLNKDSGWVFDDLYNSQERARRIAANNDVITKLEAEARNNTDTITVLNAKLSEASKIVPTVVQDTLASDTNKTVKEIKATIERIFK